MEEKDKKLCLVIPSLLPGGMERVMSELLEYFSQRSNIITSLILYGREPEIFYIVPGNIIIFRPKKAFNNKYRLLFTLKRLIFLRNTVKKIKPDVILSFGEYWNSFVLLALIGLKYPVFVSDRCSPQKKFGWIHELLRKHLYRYAHGIIAQTERAKAIYLIQNLNHNICVIGNPVRKIGSCHTEIIKENIVLSVGRLIKTKHHDLLIKAFAQIDIPDWKLIIVGDDALLEDNRKYLQSLIDYLGLNNKVVLVGNQRDVDVYYLRSKIFAFTSSSEGFPNVIGEAMAAGLPVIAFDCVAGPEELIKDGETGFIVDLFDMENYVKKLRLLISNDSLCSKLGKEGRLAIEKYSPELIGKKYLAFLTQN